MLSSINRLTISGFLASPAVKSPNNIDNLLLESVVRDIEEATDLSSMARLAYTLTWVPFHSSTDFEVFRSLLREVAEYSQAALESDTAINRLEQIERASIGIKSLRGSPILQKQVWIKSRLDKALSNWETILNRETVKLRSQVENLEIQNVYVSGPPLLPSSPVFKGRHDLFIKLERELTGQSGVPPTLLLFGARRSGKTSIIRQLPIRLGPNFIPVEIDLLSAVTSERVEGLLSGIASQIRDKALRYRNLELPKLNLDWLASDPYPAFFEWLRHVENSVGSRVILLNLDEYERFEDMIKDGRLDGRIFNWLRSLVQDYTQIVVLLSGTHAVEELPSRWSDALINVRLLRIGPLEEIDARQLITAPIPKFSLQYEPLAVDIILDATGRQPFLIQATCRDLIHYLNDKRKHYATPVDVQHALNSVLYTASAYFTEIWNGSDTDAAQRAILRVLARAGQSGLSRDELSRQTQFSLGKSLQYLLWRDIIEPLDNGYRIQAELVAQWIRNFEYL